MEIAPSFVLIEVSGEGALNLPRTNVVTLDKVAVVRVRDAHEVGEIARRARMQGLP